MQRRFYAGISDARVWKSHAGEGVTQRCEKSVEEGVTEIADQRSRLLVPLASTTAGGEVGTGRSLRMAIFLTATLWPWRTLLACRVDNRVDVRGVRLALDGKTPSTSSSLPRRKGTVPHLASYKEPRSSGWTAIWILRSKARST